jgi:predicted N-acetyltransferase YhbS
MMAAAMAYQKIQYDPTRDFLRVRDFLAATIRRLGTLFTWDISRWNYARHFVVPYRGGIGSIGAWEDRIGIWETSEGEIAGVVNGEIPGPGLAFLQLDPRHEAVLDEMISHAEDRFAVYRQGRPQVRIAVHDPFHDRFGGRLAARGYQPVLDEPDWMSERPIVGLEAVDLPPGFGLRSMADNDDVEARRTVLGLSFGHADPAEWVTPETYRELQRAPDYRKDFDLYVTAPDGAFAACCIAWHDPVNRVGTFEPVGTHPAFRRMGLGRAVIMEGINRLAALGATRAWVGSGQAFYGAIGFTKKYSEITWEKQLG